jgi:hypothetical protein
MPESRSVRPPASGRLVAVPQVAGLHQRHERGSTSTVTVSGQGTVLRILEEPPSNHRAEQRHDDQTDSGPTVCGCSLLSDFCRGAKGADNHLLCKTGRPSRGVSEKGGRSMLPDL